MGIYLLSIGEEYLKQHPSFDKIKIPTDFPLGRFFDSQCVGRSDNSRYYFFTTKNELEKLIEYLAAGKDISDDVKCKPMTLENFPEDLRKSYQALFDFFKEQAKGGV